MDYLACAWVNKTTRYGYLAILLGIWGIALSHWLGAIPLLLLGAIFLWATNFGIPTLKAYRIADKRFRRNGHLSEWLAARLAFGGPCISAGVELAYQRHLKRCKKACQEPP